MNEDTPQIIIPPCCLDEDTDCEHVVKPPKPDKRNPGV